MGQKSLPNWPDSPHKNCRCAVGSLSREQRRYLKQLGLSKEAIRLYDTLLTMGKLTAQGAAWHTFDHASAEYRLFYELEGRQLVRRHAGRPRTWSALALQIGLPGSLKNAESQLQNLLARSVDEQVKTDKTELIIGRQAAYDAYTTYAQQAKQEVLIYSIGIAYTEALAATQKSLVKRNVRIRHIMQKYQPANYHIVSKWLRIGIKLRNLPRQQGFHFFVIDLSTVCVMFSDASDVENRLSILTNNQAAVNHFAKEFDQLWAEAVAIKV